MKQTRDLLTIFQELSVQLTEIYKYWGLRTVKIRSEESNNFNNLYVSYDVFAIAHPFSGRLQLNLLC